MSELQQLGDRYEIGEVIGRGGMAEVHAGRDLRLGRRVAVKLLRSDLARDPSFHTRFQREAQASASLNHPNIVAVYDTGDAEIAGAQVPYIVMEYVDGTTLRDMIKSGHRFLPERALEIADGTLAALDYSHRHGIIHRDIKPGNVMLTRSGQVKVMDFGIARAIADSNATMTQTSAVLGTAQYLSPEQARGEVVDARSDVYSAGCMLYELLTGRPPFMGDSPVSVAYQHVRETAPPPSRVNADVPEACDTIVMRSLAKSPDDRYQSAAEMRADIDRAMAGEPLVGGVAVLGAGAAAVLGGAGAGAETATQLIAPVPAAPTTITPDADEDSGKSRTGWYVVLAVAVVAALGLTFFLGRGLFASGNKVSVPDLVGLSKQTATITLQDRHLGVGTVRIQTSTEPVDQVLSTNPAANAQVAENTPIDMVVSGGPGNVSVPTLVGLNQDQALTALTTAGLQLGTLTDKDSPQPVGQVLDSNPKAGASVVKGSKVDLVLSDGKSGVPKVVGETSVQAQADLTNAGFKPQVIIVVTTSAPDGQVISQNPVAGTALAQGKIVTITVAQAPPPPTTPPPTTPPPTATPTPTKT